MLCKIFGKVLKYQPHTNPFSFSPDFLLLRVEEWILLKTPQSYESV